MEEVQQEIILVKAKISEVEKDLKEAKSAKNEALILSRENRVAGLENRLAELQRKENLLQEEKLKLKASPTGNHRFAYIEWIDLTLIQELCQLLRVVVFWSVFLT